MSGGGGDPEVAIKAGASDSEFRALTKAELMKYAKDPFWVGVRYVRLYFMISEDRLTYPFARVSGGPCSCCSGWLGLPCWSVPLSSLFWLQSAPRPSPSSGGKRPPSTRSTSNHSRTRTEMDWETLKVSRHFTVAFHYMCLFLHGCHSTVQYVTTYSF